MAWTSEGTTLDLLEHPTATVHWVAAPGEDDGTGWLSYSSPAVCGATPADGRWPTILSSDPRGFGLPVCPACAHAVDARPGMSRWQLGANDPPDWTDEDEPCDDECPACSDGDHGACERSCHADEPDDEDEGDCPNPNCAGECNLCGVKRD